MIRNLLIGLVVFGATVWIAASAHAQSAVVVSACGTPPGTYSTGFTRAVTQNTAGLTCTSASASGTFTDDATGTTGNPVPGSAAYAGVNIGGTLRGQTGTNPTGTVYAADVGSPDGSIVSLGAKADAAWSSGSGSAIAILKSIASSVAGPIPAGTNVIGHVIVDTAPSTAVTNAGTFAVQCSLCSTAAKQPALGTAGSPSADVITVQGSATGTPLPTVTGGNTYTNITTATTTTIKSGAGVLHTVCVNALGTVASTATIYDNTAGSGTKIATLNTLALLGCQTYDVAFATGLTIVTTGTVAPDLTASSR